RKSVRVADEVRHDFAADSRRRSTRESWSQPLDSDAISIHSSTVCMPPPRATPSARAGTDSARAALASGDDAENVTGSQSSGRAARGHGVHCAGAAEVQPRMAARHFYGTECARASDCIDVDRVESVRLEGDQYLRAKSLAGGVGTVEGSEPLFAEPERARSGV